MCGRYYIQTEDMHRILSEMIDALNRRETARGSVFSVKTGEIYPGDRAPVVANNRRMTPTPFLMEWGFSMEKNKKLINARSETIHEKSMFRPLLSSRRLLVPASGYFEWEKGGEKTKYRLSADVGLIYLSGLYRPSADGGDMEFVILTRSAAPDIEFIHTRMPVILDERRAREWLDLNNDPMRIIHDAYTNVKYAKAN